MIRVQSTIYPSQKPDIKPKNLTLGEMKRYWGHNGNFNTLLYQQISIVKSK
jgi:hypothetical protein